MHNTFYTNLITVWLALAPPALVFMKKAYALACIEQLISVLDDVCIRTSVVPLCLP